MIKEYTYDPQMEIPEFLKRSAEERAAGWGRVDAEKRRMSIVNGSVILAGLIANPDKLPETSQPELVAAYNEAIKSLERPGDVVTDFKDMATAIQKVRGVLVELKAEKSISAKTKNGDDEMKTQTQTRTGSKKVPAAVAARGAKNLKAGSKPTGKAQKVAAGASKVPAARAAPTPAKEAPAHKGNKPVEAIRTALGAKEGGFQGNLLEALIAKQGKQVPLKEVLKAVYNATSDAHAKKIDMVIVGLRKRIADKGQHFAVHKQTVDGETSIGFYVTK